MKRFRVSESCKQRRNESPTAEMLSEAGANSLEQFPLVVTYVVRDAFSIDVMLGNGIHG